MSVRNAIDILKSLRHSGGGEGASNQMVIEKDVLPLLEASVQVSDLFQILQSTELLQEICNKIQIELDDSAIIGYLEGCIQALDSDEEEAERVLRNAIDVLQDIWCRGGKGVAAGILRGRADDLRARGWSVAVHNDYRQNGQSYTFWLFTKDGHAVKGEARTDAEALDQVREEIAKLESA